MTVEVHNNANASAPSNMNRISACFFSLLALSLLMIYYFQDKPPPTILNEKVHGKDYLSASDARKEIKSYWSSLQHQSSGLWAYQSQLKKIELASAHVAAVYSTVSISPKIHLKGKSNLTKHLTPASSRKDESSSAVIYSHSDIAPSPALATSLPLCAQCRATMMLPLCDRCSWRTMNWPVWNHRVDKALEVAKTIAAGTHQNLTLHAPSPSLRRLAEQRAEEAIANLRAAVHAERKDAAAAEARHAARAASILDGSADTADTLDQDRSSSSNTARHVSVVHRRRAQCLSFCYLEARSLFQNLDLLPSVRRTPDLPRMLSAPERQVPSARRGDVANTAVHSNFHDDRRLEVGSLGWDTAAMPDSDAGPWWLHHAATSAGALSHAGAEEQDLDAAPLRAAAKRVASSGATRGEGRPTSASSSGGQGGAGSLGADAASGGGGGDQRLMGEVRALLRRAAEDRRRILELAAPDSPHPAAVATSTASDLAASDAKDDGGGEEEADGAAWDGNGKGRDGSDSPGLFGLALTAGAAADGEGGVAAAVPSGAKDYPGSLTGSSCGDDTGTDGAALSSAAIARVGASDGSTQQPRDGGGGSSARVAPRTVAERALEDAEAAQGQVLRDEALLSRLPALMARLPPAVVSTTTIGGSGGGISSSRESIRPVAGEDATGSDRAG